MFLRELHFFRGLEQRYHNLRGVKVSKPPKPPKIGPAFSSKNAKILQRQYFQNSKSNQVEIWSLTGDHEVLIFAILSLLQALCHVRYHGA